MEPLKKQAWEAFHRADRSVRRPLMDAPQKRDLLAVLAGGWTLVEALDLSDEDKARAAIVDLRAADALKAAADEKTDRFSRPEWFAAEVLELVLAQHPTEAPQVAVISDNKEPDR